MSHTESAADSGSTPASGNIEQGVQADATPEEAFAALFSVYPARKDAAWQALIAMALDSAEPRATIALNALLIAHNNDPDDVAGHISKMWAAGQDAEVAAIADKLLERDNTQPNFYVWRGQTELRLQQYDRAVADLRRAVDLLPQFAEAYLWLSSALDNLGNEGEALKIAQQAATLAPENALIQINLGWVLYRAGDYTGSIAASTRALALDSNSFNSVYGAFNLGLALLASHDQEHAISAYEQGVAICARLTEGEANTALASGLKDLADLAQTQPELQAQIAVCTRLLRPLPLA